MFSSDRGVFLNLSLYDKRAVQAEAVFGGFSPAEIISTFSEITYLPAQRDLRMDTSAFVEAKKRVSQLIKKREEEEKTRPSLRGKAPECPPPSAKPNGKVWFFRAPSE